MVEGVGLGYFWRMGERGVTLSPSLWACLGGLVYFPRVGASPQVLLFKGPERDSLSCV